MKAHLQDAVTGIVNGEHRFEAPRVPAAGRTSSAIAAPRFSRRTHAARAPDVATRG